MTEGDVCQLLKRTIGLISSEVGFDQLTSCRCSFFSTCHTYRSKSTTVVAVKTKHKHHFPVILQINTRPQTNVGLYSSIVPRLVAQLLLVTVCVSQSGAHPRQEGLRVCRRAVGPRRRRLGALELE